MRFEDLRIPPQPRKGPGIRRLWGVFTYARRALGLVWDTHRGFGLALVGLGLLSGALPPAMALVGKRIVDTVVLAVQIQQARSQVVAWVMAEFLLVTLFTAVGRARSVLVALLRVRLTQRVGELVLNKALTLELEDFENPELYDRMSRIQREVSFRPLGLVQGALSLFEHSITLSGFALLLWEFSPFLLVLLAVAALPSFVAEAKFNTDAFRLFRWQSPDARRQTYLETVLGRDDHAKEVRLFELGPLLVGRHRAIFQRLYAQDRGLTLRRGLWGFGLGLLSAGAAAAAYLAVASAAIDRTITLGSMTMLLLVLKQSQSSLQAALMAAVRMYDDHLYVSLLGDFLAHPTRPRPVVSVTSGPDPAAGLRLERVSFTYPGATDPALREVSLQVPPGTKLALVGSNGAGKSTLIKLITRLYHPTEGRVLLDGRDLEEWDAHALRQRVGVILQDFVHYQLLAGENVGVGDVDAFSDADRWHEAARMGLAHPDIERLPEGYHTQLGRWFEGGQELSLGQWQRIALSRAFMRKSADILVLDEPTASLDAESEFRLFEHFRQLSDGRIAIVVSHRFSSVRMADRIVVLDGGRVVEQGSHAELVAHGGRYARLFTLQSAAYR
jgi:ATP-binding cassette subfamily B protein